jgi:probable rRNA maturation factor
MSELVLRNRQRERSIHLPLLRDLTQALLEDELGLTEYELGILLVSPKTMARVNREFLGHEGVTDVITFDHREAPRATLFGELYICVAAAEEQAGRFGTTWQEELARYVVHGILHLLGYDDLSPEPRRKMKREEARRLKALTQKFPVRRLGQGIGKPRARGKKGAS